MGRHAIWMALLALTFSACGSDDEGTEAPASRPDLSGELPYDNLSAYGFFLSASDGTLAGLSPAPGVVLYEPAAPLWSDDTAKARHVYLPEGKTFQSDGDEEWAAPVGTVVIKSFGYHLDKGNADSPVYQLETRLLIREADEWSVHTYVWNEAQTEAVRTVAGKRLTMRYTGADGSPVEQPYIVPNTNQCASCHARGDDDDLHLLGMAAYQLDRQVVRDGETVSQLDWLTAQGLFSSPKSAAEATPLVDPYGDGSVEDRARSWLHANCAHCHRPGGKGGRSGLVLLAHETDLGKVGLCKSPVAAGSGTGGFSFDIDPGAPESSIMIFRMRSTNPDEKMPEIPNLQIDEPGIQVVEAWIKAMEPGQCELD
ncbi:MAG: hypothetical protein ACE366_26590 [Bradymonadia bacterium]